MKTKKSKLILKAIKKTFKLRYLAVLIVLLAANSFAWFIYSSQVSGAITARVKAWDVTFQSGDEEVTSYVNIDVSDIYPGMDDYQKDIVAYNKSELPAKINYTVLSASILGKSYTTKEGRTYNKEDATGDEMTSDEFLEYLENTYPFKITMSTDKEEMEASTDQATFTVKVTWAFESGDDDTDTYWGTQAAKFIEKYPSKACITLNVLLKIEQIDE